MKILGIIILAMIAMTFILYVYTKRKKQDLKEALEGIIDNDGDLLNIDPKSRIEEQNDLERDYEFLRNLTIATVIFYIVLLYIM